MKIKLFMVVLLMVGLSACGQKPMTSNATDIKLSKNFGVTLFPRPHKHEPTVEIKTKAQGWGKDDKDGRKNGYVGYKQGEFGITFFIVRNEDVGDSCRNEGGHAKWVITQLLISATGDEVTEKGTDFGKPQPEWLEEAFPNVDVTDGSLFTADEEHPGVTCLSVINANQQAGYKFIYYEVTLTRCSDGLALTTDPGWGNGGR